MLSAITDGSLASSPMILSAGGHDEHPCDVNSSTTARGSAWAGRPIAATAQIPSAPEKREIRLKAIIVVITGNRKTPVKVHRPRTTRTRPIAKNHQAKNHYAKNHYQAPSHGRH